MSLNSLLYVLTIFVLSPQYEKSHCQSIPPGEGVIRDSIVPINALPAPVIALTALADTLCATPGNLGTYKWYHCGETKVLGTSSCLVIASSGCYCVEGKNALGRTAESCMDFFLPGSAPPFRDAITITPNPTFGNFHVTLYHDSFLPVEWRLLDFTGKEIETGKLEEKSNDLDFSDHSVGLYWIQFFSNGDDIAMNRIIIAE